MPWSQLQRRRAFPLFADAKGELTMIKITKLALISALLVSTLSAASAQSFNGSQDNQPGYMQQQNAPQNERNKSYVGESGGA
jgi:hypothetical protein